MRMRGVNHFIVSKLSDKSDEWLEKVVRSLCKSVMKFYETIA